MSNICTTCPGEKFVSNVLMYTKKGVSPEIFTLCTFCYSNKCLSKHEMMKRKEFQTSEEIKEDSQTPPLHDENSQTSQEIKEDSHTPPLHDENSQLNLEDSQLNVEDNLNPETKFFTAANCNCPIHRVKEDFSNIINCIKHQIRDEKWTYSSYFNKKCPKCNYYFTHEDTEHCITCAIKISKCPCGKDSFRNIMEFDSKVTGRINVQMNNLINYFSHSVNIESLNDVNLLFLFPDIIPRLILIYEKYKSQEIGKLNEELYDSNIKVLQDILDKIKSDEQSLEMKSLEHFPRIISSIRYHNDFTKLKYSSKDIICSNFVPNKVCFLERRTILLSSDVEVDFLIFYSKSSIVNDNYETLNMLLTNEYSFNLDNLLNEHKRNNIIDFIISIIKKNNHLKVISEIPNLPFTFDRDVNRKVDKDSLFDVILTNSIYVEFHNQYYHIELIILYYQLLISYIFLENIIAKEYKGISIMMTDDSFEKFSGITPCILRGIIRLDIKNTLEHLYNKSEFPSNIKEMNYEKFTEFFYELFIVHGGILSTYFQVLEKRNSKFIDYSKFNAEHEEELKQLQQFGNPEFSIISTYDEILDMTYTSKNGFYFYPLLQRNYSFNYSLLKGEKFSQVKFYPSLKDENINDTLIITVKDEYQYQFSLDILFLKFISIFVSISNRTLSDEVQKIFPVEMNMKVILHISNEMKVELIKDSPGNKLYLKFEFTKDFTYEQYRKFVDKKLETQLYMVNISSLA